MRRMYISIMMIIFMTVLPIGNTFSALESSPEIEDSALQGAQEAGTYPVTVRYVDGNGNVTETVIYVTIRYPRTVESEESQEAIDAHDLEIPRGTFSQLGDVQLKKLTGVHAWNTGNGMAVEVTRAERIIVDEKIGVYQVRFSTAKNTQTLVNIIERDKVYSKTAEFYIDLLDIVRFRWIELSMIFLLILPIILLYVNYRRISQQIKKVDRLLYEKIKRK